MVGEMSCSVASLVVEVSSVVSRGLVLVFSPVVLEVAVGDVFVNGEVVVSLCFVVAVAASEVGLPLEFLARVVGFVLVPFDVVVAAVVVLLFDGVVAAVVVLLFDAVVAAVVALLFDGLVATVVVLLFDVVVAAVVVLLSLLEALEAVLLPLVVHLIVAAVNGNVAGLTVETTVGEVTRVSFVVLPRPVGAFVHIQIILEVIYQ